MPIVLSIALAVFCALSIYLQRREAAIARRLASRHRSFWFGQAPFWGLLIGSVLLLYLEIEGDLGMGRQPFYQQLVFGLLLGLLGAHWMFTRGRAAAEEVEQLRIFWLRKSDLSFGLFALVLIGAVVLTETPNFLRNIQLSFSGDGLKVSLNDTLDSLETGETGTFEAEQGETDSTGDGNTLVIGAQRLGVVVDQSTRDLDYVCALAGRAACLTAIDPIRRYSENVEGNLRAVTACFAQVASRTLDRELSKTLMRPALNAYRLFADAVDRRSGAGGAPGAGDAVSVMRGNFVRALVRMQGNHTWKTLSRIADGDDDPCIRMLAFSRGLKEEVAVLNGLDDIDRVEDDEIAEWDVCAPDTELRLRDGPARFCKAMEADGQIPYARIVHALQANFLGDVLGSAVTLQKWLDAYPALPLGGVEQRPDTARRAWLRYIVKFYQNELLLRTPELERRPADMRAALRFEHSGRDLLNTFQAPFVRHLEDGSPDCAPAHSADDEGDGETVETPPAKEPWPDIDYERVRRKIYFQYLTEAHYQLRLAVVDKPVQVAQNFERFGSELVQLDARLARMEEIHACFVGAYPEATIRYFRAEFLALSRAEYEVARLTHDRRHAYGELKRWTEHRGEPLAVAHLNRAIALTRPQDLPPLDATMDRDRLVRLIVAGEQRTRYLRFRMRLRQIEAALD